MAEKHKTMIKTNSDSDSLGMISSTIGAMMAERSPTIVMIGMLPVPNNEFAALSTEDPVGKVCLVKDAEGFQKILIVSGTSDRGYQSAAGKIFSPSRVKGVIRTLISEVIDHER